MLASLLQGVLHAAIPARSWEAGLQAEEKSRHMVSDLGSNPASSPTSSALGQVDVNLLGLSPACQVKIILFTNSWVIARLK